MDKNAAADPRAEFVDRALRFLKNAKVADSPLEQKIAFLESKGLTSQVPLCVRACIIVCV
jgi:hypothetical protein